MRGKLLKKAIIESKLGTFEATCKKEFCNNIYHFEAKQIAIKVDGRLYLVPSPRLAKVELCSFDNSTEYIDVPSSRRTIELQRHRKTYIGEIMKYRRLFKLFCNEIGRH